MNKNAKFLIQLAMAGLILLFFVAPALAEETKPVDPAAVVSETEVTAEELGVSESAILPGSVFYFLKEWGWKIQEALTANDDKKTELVQKHVNQRLFDLQQVLEKNPELLSKVQKTLTKSGENLDKLKEKMDKLAEKNNPQADKLVEKFSNQAFKQVRLLDRLMAKIKERPRSVEKLKEQVQNNLGEVLEKVDQEKVGDVLDKAEPRLNSVEVLKKVEAKLLERGNDRAAEAIRKAYLRKIEKINEIEKENKKNKEEKIKKAEDDEKVEKDDEQEVEKEEVEKEQPEAELKSNEQSTETVLEGSEEEATESPELLNRN